MHQDKWLWTRFLRSNLVLYLFWSRSQQRICDTKEEEQKSE